MAVREADVGIQAYTDSLPGFTAVLKHTWYDFHVNEIGLDGKVVHLTSLEPPVASNVPEEELSTAEGMDPEDPIGFVASQFSQLVGEENAEKLRTLAADADAASMQPIEVGPISDKQKRTEVHMFCKKELPGLPPLATESVKKDETGETFVRIARLSTVKKMKDWQNRKRERRGNKSTQSYAGIACGVSLLGVDSKGETCRYVHFVLYKENTDNQMALNIIAKELRIPPTVFRCAGMKDKRGVTTQRIAGQNVDIHALAKLNAKLKYMKVGNFEPLKENLYVGDLMGNQFRIVLRDVPQPSISQVREACASLKEHGFVNYFGLQRFGQGTPTHSVGRALLKGDWKGAARLILQPCPSDDAATTRAKQRYEQGDIEGALELLPRHALSERALLQGYSELGPEQHLSSINRIGRNTRTLYSHAYQSYVWNRAVSERIARFGPDKVLEGDLVIEDDAEAPSSGRQTSGKRLKSVKQVTVEDLESNRYSIMDVVLPLPGGSIEYPKNAMEQIYQKVADEDSVSLTKSVHKVKEFSIEKLSGDYRKILVSVEDLEYDIVPYYDSNAPLIQSDLDLLQGSQGAEVSAVESKEPEDETKKRKHEADESDQRKRPKTDDEKWALKLKFQLPASCYATMVVRQLTKYSTSKSDQVAISNPTKSETDQS